MHHGGIRPSTVRAFSVGETYSLAESWAAVLFGAVLLVQLSASILFWRAFLDRDAANTPDHPKVLQAFSVSGGLFAGFLIADELFTVYDRLPALETTHLLVLCALLLSLVVTSLLSRRGHAT